MTVSMMPIFFDKYRSSRVLGVEFPFGHSFGTVHDREMQARTLRAALELLEAAPGPETRVDVDERWPVEAMEAYKSWQPSEHSPIVAQSIDQIRRTRREAAALES